MKKLYKRIISLIMIALLLLSCSCKKEVQEEQSASVPETKTEQVQQPAQSDPESAETETEPSQNEESPVWQNSPPNHPAELEEPANESVTTNLPKASAEQLETAQFLMAQKDGEIYYNSFDKITLADPLSYVYPYADIDRAELIKTDEKMLVYLMGGASFPVDGTEAFAGTQATVYELPDYVKNDKSVKVLALKPDISEEIIIFSTYDSWSEDFSLGAYVAKKCSGVLKDSGKISEIIITRFDKTQQDVSVKDAEDIKAIFEKIRDYQYSKDLAKPSGKPSCTIELKYRSGASTKFTFYAKEETMTENRYTCKTDADFKEYLDSFFK